jgi:hypothetical protein
VSTPKGKFFSGVGGGKGGAARDPSRRQAGGRFSIPCGPKSGPCGLCKRAASLSKGKTCCRPWKRCVLCGATG